MKKSKTRIYINKQISSNLLIYIKNKQHHYLKNVMRIQINDSIKIFDGITGEWLSNVLSINRDSTVLRVIEKTNNIVKGLDVWLIFAPIKQHRMSIAIQKATELGVSKIFPCLTKYTNFKKININNLQLNAIEAAEQSERLDVPKIENPKELHLLLASWPKDRHLIFCDEKDSCDNNIVESLLSLKNSNNKRWGVLVGPEGGFSAVEKDLINKNKSAIAVSLGKRVLRSDTAITVSLFCIQQLLD